MIRTEPDTSTEDTLTGEPMDLEEILDSLTGWDEIAIRKAFGSDPYALRGLMVARSALFIALRRAGRTDHDAHRIAMGMSARELSERVKTPDTKPGPAAPTAAGPGDVDDLVDEDEDDDPEGKASTEPTSPSGPTSS